MSTPTMPAVALPPNTPPEVVAIVNDLKNVATEEDNLAVQFSIMGNILSAETEEDILAAGDAGTLSSDEYVGIPFRVKDSAITWKFTADRYLKEGAFPFFALVNIVDADNKPQTMTAGGMSVVATLYALQKKGIIAQYGEQGMPLVIDSKKTNAGFDVLFLRKPDDKAKK